MIVLAVGCAGHDCDLAANLNALAGGGARDCGEVAIGADASTVDACVQMAFVSGTPFIARYDRQGTDSHVVSGLAGDSRGHVVFSTWDSAPCGGQGCSQSISEDVCNGPMLNTSATRDPSQMLPISCTGLTSRGRICG
jgi:hypothetical protein